jgi:hypothetical protein
VTTPRRKPIEHSISRDAARFVPSQPSEEDLRELREPYYDLGGPDYPEQWLPGLPRRPEYVVVIAQRSDLRPDQPSSLAGVLGTGHTRSHDPEPDWEAEP